MAVIPAIELGRLAKTLRADVTLLILAARRYGTPDMQRAVTATLESLHDAMTTQAMALEASSRRVEPGDERLRLPLAECELAPKKLKRLAKHSIVTVGDLLYRMMKADSEACGFITLGDICRIDDTLEHRVGIHIAFEAGNGEIIFGAYTAKKTRAGRAR